MKTQQQYNYSAKFLKESIVFKIVGGVKLLLPCIATLANLGLGTKQGVSTKAGSQAFLSIQYCSAAFYTCSCRAFYWNCIFRIARYSELSKSPMHDINMESCCVWFPPSTSPQYMKAVVYRHYPLILLHTWPAAACCVYILVYTCIICLYILGIKKKIPGIIIIGSVEPDL